MARRQKSPDFAFIQAIAGMIGLLFLVLIYHPTVRKWAFALAVLLVAALAIAMIACGMRLTGQTDRTSSADDGDIWPINTKPWTRLTVDTKSAAPSHPSTVTPLPFGKPTSSTDAGDLAGQIRRIDWFQFEKLIELLYRKQGYRVIRRGGANPDGGIDLVIEKEGERTAVQCKQWKAWKVGVKTVREFVGALTDAGISAGVLITICGSSREAEALARRHRISLMTEQELLTKLRSVEAHRDPEIQALLSDPRKFCPKCGRPLVQRTASKGRNLGERFWGCSAYPRCRFTMPWSKDHRTSANRKPHSALA